ITAAGDEIRDTRDEIRSANRISSLVDRISNLVSRSVLDEDQELAAIPEARRDDPEVALHLAVAHHRGTEVHRVLAGDDPVLLIRLGHGEDGVEAAVELLEHLRLQLARRLQGLAAEDQELAALLD